MTTALPSGPAPAPAEDLAPHSPRQDPVDPLLALDRSPLRSAPQEEENTGLNFAVRVCLGSLSPQQAARGHSLPDTYVERHKNVSVP